MAEKKIDEFTTEEIELASIAKALSHPARIKILKILNDMNSFICGQIVEQMPLSQATVSQHLKELKNAGLIKGEIEGPKTCYCINGKQLQHAGAIIEKLFTKLKNCC